MSSRASPLTITGSNPFASVISQVPPSTYDPFAVHSVGSEVPKSISVYNRFCKENECYSHLKLNAPYFATTMPNDSMLRIHEAEENGKIVAERRLLFFDQDPNFAIVFSRVWKNKHYIVTHLESKRDCNGNAPSYSVHCFDPLYKTIKAIAERISHPIILQRRLITWGSNEHSSYIKFFRLKDGLLKASVTISRDLWDKIDVTPSNDKEDKRYGVVEVSNDLSNRSGPLLKFNEFGELCESSFTYGGKSGKHIHSYITWEPGPETTSNPS